MAKISQHFGNSYMSADDVTPKGETYTIAAVSQEQIGSDDRLVVYFEEVEKGLPLNKTNAFTLAEALGDDTLDWTGKQIALFRESTTFQGKRTPCIRARPVKGMRERQGE
jgi:hypothetical protein